MGENCTRGFAEELFFLLHVKTRILLNALASKMKIFKRCSVYRRPRSVALSEKNNERIDISDETWLPVWEGKRKHRTATERWRFWCEIKFLTKKKIRKWLRRRLDVKAETRLSSLQYLFMLVVDWCFVHLCHFHLFILVLCCYRHFRKQVAGTA